MVYDPLTLWLLIVFVALVMTGVMLLSWATTPGAGALGYWAAGMAASGIGIAAFAARGHLPGFVSIVLANAALLLGGGLLWAGCRRLSRPPDRTVLPAILLPPALWIAACALPPFDRSTDARIALFAVLMMLPLAAAMHDLLRGGCKGRPARILAVGVLAAQIANLASRFVVLSVYSFDGRDDFVLRADPVLAAYGLIGLAFLVILGFVMMALVREEREIAYRQVSLTDEMTGLLNRRGLLEQASALAPGRAFAVLVLDLDRLKQLNDRHGHAAGDGLLELFGRVLRAEIGAAGVGARLGGDEFAVLLPRAGLEEARLVAERIRAALLREVAASGPAGAAGTVSIGIAAGPSPLDAGANPFGPALARADAALYRAKALGRDRIEALAERAVSEAPPAAALRAAG